MRDGGSQAVAETRKAQALDQTQVDSAGGLRVNARRRAERHRPEDRFERHGPRPPSNRLDRCLNHRHGGKVLGRHL